MTKSVYKHNDTAQHSARCDATKLQTKKYISLSQCPSNNTVLSQILLKCLDFNFLSRKHFRQWTQFIHTKNVAYDCSSNSRDNALSTIFHTNVIHGYLSFHQCCWQQRHCCDECQQWQCRSCSCHTMSAITDMLTGCHNNFVCCSTVY